eukprot:symbB.v1.2.040856.t1/scaffold7595.1/size10827/1
MQTMMMYQLGQDWFQAKAMRRVEVHVCSLSIAEHRRRNMESYQVLQAAQIARVFRLADSKRDIIFVAPKHIHEDVLDYYSKIMQFRGVQNPPGRFQVVVPENIDIKDKFSLTQALLCSPKALKRIGRLVRNRMAMLIPEVVTHAEAKLSNTLRLPLIGPSARNMSLLSSKSNGKKLAQLAQLPIGPWAVDIYDEFYNSLAGLVVKHPEVRTWLFKIDDERSSRGTAYIDLLKMQQVSQSAYASAPALLGGAEVSTEPAVIGADAAEVRAMLQHHVPRRSGPAHGVTPAPNPGGADKGKGNRPTPEAEPGVGRVKEEKESKDSKQVKAPEQAAVEVKEELRRRKEKAEPGEVAPGVSE